MLDGARTGWKHIKKEEASPLPLRIASPNPSEGRGVQIEKGLRVYRKLIDTHFIDYNLILNRL